MAADLQARKVTRVTIMVHKGLRTKLLELLAAIGINYAFVENARCVRQNIKQSFFGFPGLNVELSGTSTLIFRLTIFPDDADKVLSYLIKGLELNTPGRGAAFAQDMTELSQCREVSIDLQNDHQTSLLKDLVLITGIQSKHGAGQKLSRVALKLGVGVPVVGIGTGTGIRDRMGLLRITISPEKELIYLMVPAHDANGLQNLLIDEGQLNRPGGGFLYQTPIRAGMVDTLTKIGQQEHAASIEQIIAAIDDLKRSTAWRKRFFGMETVEESQVNFTHKEISFFCKEGDADQLVEAAMEAGAGGATTSRLGLVQLRQGQEEKSVPYELGILCVSADLEKPVCHALQKTAADISDSDLILQSLQASSVFYYKGK